MARIDLITIDLDDTLWPCMPVILAAEQALLDWLRAEAPGIGEAHDIDSLRAHRQQVSASRPDIAHDMTAVRLLSLQRLMESFGYDPALAKSAMAHFLDHRNRVKPYEDVAPVLSKLRQRYTLISVTNGNARVEGTPLGSFFHHAVTAAEAGAAKPHPAVFERALSHADASPEHTLHVGDEPRLDIEAACALGMRTAWVNRSGRDWPGDIARPDCIVQDFFELERWLAEQ